MSLRSGIFNSTTVETTDTGLVRGDRAVDAAFLARMFSTFFRNGVAPGEDGSAFAPTVLENSMRVRSLPGACHINGYFAYDDAYETRTFSVSDSDRCAARVLRLDLGERSIRPLWRSCIRQDGGLYSEEDGVMLPIRTDDIYDLVTCVVDIPAGVTALSDDMVTDTRADDTLCGFVKPLGG